MTKTRIRLAVNGPQATITFHTEDGINILSPNVMHTLGAAIAKVKKQAGVRTAVVRAEGRVFLAGSDVEEIANYGPNDAREYGSLGQGVLNDLAALPSITVAAIHGAAMGGGLELAVACDFRIAVKSAKLGLPEASLGLIPAWGGIPRLTKLVGPSRAKKLYLSAMTVSAEDGAAFGLVDEVVNSAEDLGPRVAAFCRLFRRASPAAVALAKRASRDMDDLRAFTDCFRTQDCREGVVAFLEKRPASWME